MIKNEITVVGFAAIVITTILCIILVYLLARKIREIRSEKEKRRIKETIQLPLFQYLLNGEQSAEIERPCGSKLGKEALQETLSQYAEILEDRKASLQIALLAENHLAEDYRRMLKSKRWSRRMNALYFVESFGVTSLTSEVLSISKRKKSTVSEKMYSLRILAAVQHPDFFQMLHQADYMSETDYRQILLRLKEEDFASLIDQFSQCSETLQCALLDVISIKKDGQHLPFAEQVFHTWKGEQRIRALKAIIEIGYIKEPEVFIPLSVSQRWEERMLAAKLFGAVKDQNHWEILYALLHDTSWWVRYQAGQSIAGLAGGWEKLELVIEKDDDPFARDMAWEWLHKGVVS